MKNFHIHWRWIIIGICLTGCQHIQLARSPLPVKIVDDSSTAKTHLSSGRDPIGGMAALPQKNRPTKPTATPEVRTGIFLLEDWF